MASFFDTKIDFLKGIGPQKAAVINKELAIFTYGDLLQHYPFRHEDRTVFHSIAEASEDMSFVQFKGTLVSLQMQGDGVKKRLTAQFRDKSGVAELVWFKSINWISSHIKVGVEYVVFGKPSYFRDTINIVHPEIEPLTSALEKAGKLRPVYHTSEKMKNFGLDSKGISNIMAQLVELAKSHITENLSAEIIHSFKLVSKAEAVLQIHFPTSQQQLNQAIYRLKFEELFYAQLKFLRLRSRRKQQNSGILVQHIPLVNEFYKHHLPFELTNAQKKVIREIYLDMGIGKQMNRLLQGDVGSGKTIVAFICMLMLIDQQAQVCLMAPTEILADQHYTSLKYFADKLNITITKLTGSTKAKDRKVLLQQLADGEIKIIVGTHALIEDKVVFKNLGLCVIDEQHKFGVAQRAKLWAKNLNVASHVLVMTATPIPRTLAMAFYGDLDVSVIDELPAGRKPIKTVHRFESQRLAVIGFMKEEIRLGRQIYIVFPLIEESEKIDLQDLYTGYDAILKDFPQPEYQTSVVHGRLASQDKDFEMQRFIKGETHIMLATTVIEVGVNVPNASVMLIENAERFGLAQLHQLRGRVGRGADQSYCILMTSSKISQDSREKLATMVRTNNGFEIAEADLKLRGPGDLMGTQQSGVMDLKLADLAKDHDILKAARETAQALVADDPNLVKPQNIMLFAHLQSLTAKSLNWSRIS